jgi:hypothetical protein
MPLMSGLGLDELLGDRLALLAGEFAGLLEHHLETGRLVLDAVLEALGAVVVTLLPAAPSRMATFALAAGRLDHLVGGPLALLHEVGADEVR